MRPVYDEEEKQSADTEITLGMKSLLGVFFGSVLICGVFFGFGYSLGRNSLHPAASSAKAASANDAGLAVAVKPANHTDSSTPTAAQAAAAPLTTVVSNDANQEAAATPAATAPAERPVAPPAQKQFDYVATPNGPARRPADATTPPPAHPKASPAIVAESEPAPRPSPVAVRPAAAPATSAPVSAGGQPVMVQIAAVANQEDAGILVSALKKHGYSVSIRTEPTDKLLHIQLGPFASRDDARAMRAKLLADGYNAILK